MGRTNRESYNAYMRQYMANRYERRKKEAIDRLGGRCTSCGSVENLEIDHIERSRKSFTITKYLAGCSKEKFEQELAKCQLLCERCHQSKTIREQGKQEAKGQHGTLSTYRWCGPPKCEDCKKAKREAQRAWRQRVASQTG